MMSIAKMTDSCLVLFFRCSNGYMVHMQTCCAILSTLQEKILFQGKCCVKKTKDLLETKIRHVQLQVSSISSQCSPNQRLKCGTFKCYFMFHAAIFLRLKSLFVICLKLAVYCVQSIIIHVCVCVCACVHACVRIVLLDKILCCIICFKYFVITIVMFQEI